MDNPGRNNLGIVANTLHASREAKRSADLVEAGLVAKTRRYVLQRTAQALLFVPADGPAQQFRVCWCSRSLMGDHVGVYRTAAGTSSRFSGINTCGSVWHCPVCSAKITEARRKELDKALTGWVKKGGKVQLMTLTFPHEADQALDPLMVKFAKALQSFKNCRAYKRVMTGAGRAGSIRSLETTWGSNGWHPHTHDLVFLERDLTLAEVDTLKSEWARICLKAGLGEQSKLSDMLLHGLDMADGRFAAEYIAKFGHDAQWGAAAELTKPHSKVGKVGEFGGDDHYTPFQLLAWAAGGDEKAGALFREFGEVFHGKRMLSWSPEVKDKEGNIIRKGLRTLLTGCEKELTDEELAAHDEPIPDESRVGQLNPDQFKVLLSRNRLGDFLGYVARCCNDPETAQDDIDAYIKSIEKLKPTHGSTFKQRNHFGPGWSVLG